jgi:hypothetical protein
MMLVVFTILAWGIASFFYKISNAHLHPVMSALIASPIYYLLSENGT